MNESSSKAENVGEPGKKGSVQLSIFQGAETFDKRICLKDIAGFWEGSDFPGVLDTHDRRC